MSFDQYEAERLRLRGRCRKVEQLWNEIQLGRSEVEKVAGEDVTKGASAVEDLMRQATLRLASASVEVGIFGSIKRGKSTLINALVGAEVSPMRVTPETAVPVWIESGPLSTAVDLSDGSVLEDLDHDEALTMATQRYRPSKANRKPIRVRTRRHIPWLPEGVRIVDTPGLDDPSLAEDYERLTMAELERVAAAVFVFLSPPGPSGEELKLLRTLGERGVDKVFLVCNMYPDHWSDLNIREDMKRHIGATVLDGTGSDFNESDLRVFMISARDALVAVKNKDSEAFELSGVAELRRQLEQHLTHGSLSRMLDFVERRIGMSCQLIADALLQRRTLVTNPSGVKAHRDYLKNEIGQSRKLITDFEGQLRRAAKEINEELVSTLARPFEEAIGAAKEAKKTSDIERLSARLAMQFQAAATEASTLFEQRASLEYARLHRKLFESFGTQERLRQAATELRLSHVFSDLVPTVPTSHTDWATVSAAGVVTGTVAGLASATLAGGVGTALLLAGPVGWLIGLGVGALIGSGFGAVVARQVTKDTIGPDQRQQVTVELARKIELTKAQAKTASESWVETVLNSLNQLRTAYFDEKERELAHLETIIGDVNKQQLLIASIERQLEAVRTLVEG